MPDFQWVQAPIFSPTICCACNTHSNPRGFADLLAEDVSGRRLYLCATCIDTAALLVGALTFDQKNALFDAHDEAVGIRADLEAQLADARENKLVSLADVRKLVAQAPVSAA